ncbi:hypothetical protein CISIN_1g040769mg [Citrus sinensis]|uniref:Homeobox-leucine zipper protein n=1 Tax=Citrus sinensis TaxID=2711 RepID=A0A067F0W5_CITSI|nr:hypothetical protein CISIN_1g040769mg [Citrus sinensis]
MDWSSTTGNLRTFVPVFPRPETSFDLLYNYNYDQFPGMDQMNKHMHAAAAAAAMAEKSSSSIGLIPAAELMEKNIHHYGSSSTSSQERKKRLTSDQLESLERSFQEEIKLDPDRKMKLARELGLQPRQIAVWFQNRRARWKSKQLELLYDSLKQEYDAVSREKLKLQEEVMKLKRMLKEQGTSTRNMMNKQVSTGITEVSGEETVESTSVATINGSFSNKHHQISECNYLFNVDEEFNAAAAPLPSPFWGLLPTSFQ